MDGNTIRSIIKQSYNSKFASKDDQSIKVKSNSMCFNDNLNFRPSIAAPIQLSPYKLSRKNSLSITNGLYELGSLLQSKDKNTFSYIQVRDINLNFRRLQVLIFKRLCLLNIQKLICFIHKLLFLICLKNRKF